MRKFLEKYPLFLLLLPAFVVIHLENEWHSLIQYKFVYDRVIILFIAPPIILGIWYLFFRTIAIASLITISSLLPFYYTGDLKSWLSVKFPHSFLQSYSFLLSAFAVVLLILFFYFKKKANCSGKDFSFYEYSLTSIYNS